MSALWLDIEVLADREEDIQALFAELAREDGAEHEVPRRDDEPPPILQDEVPSDGWDTWGEAA